MIWAKSFPCLSCIVIDKLKPYFHRASSPISGLFQQAIMLSGSVLSPFAMANKPIRYGRSLAKQLDCPSEGHQNLALVECLRKKAVSQLLSIKYQIPTHLTIFGPTVDRIVIPKEPILLMSEERSLFKSYPLLAGATESESWNLFNEYDKLQGIDIQRKDRMVRTLVRNLFDFHLQVRTLTGRSCLLARRDSSRWPIAYRDDVVREIQRGTVEKSSPGTKRKRYEYYHTQMTAYRFAFAICCAQKWLRSSEKLHRVILLPLGVAGQTRCGI